MKVKQIKNWYGWGGIDIHNIGTSDFQRQAMSSLQFILTAADAFGTWHKHFKLTVTADNGGSASCIPKERKVFIGTHYVNGDTLKGVTGRELDDDSRYTLLGAINGSMLHEGLHLALTRHNKYEMKQAQKLYRNLFPLFWTIFQVVEDIYIETRAVAHGNTTMYRSLKWLDHKNELFFGDYIVNQIIAEGTSTIEDAVSAITIFKLKSNTRKKALRNLFPKKVMSQLTKIRARAKNVSEIDRLTESHIIFRMLLEHYGVSPDPSTEGDSEKLDKKSGQTAPDAPVTFGASSTDAKDKKELQDSIDEEVEKEGAPSTEVPQFIGGELRNVPKVTEKNILDGEETYFTHVYNFNWDIEFDASFIRELSALNTKHYAHGALRTSGTHIQKSGLHRIVTTGKIFSRNDSERDTMPRREVIINIDASGSTEGDVFSNEIRTARKISDAMKQARIPHIVVAHTQIDYRFPILYRIVNFLMGPKLNGTDNDRWEKLVNVRKSNNYDGRIIQHLVKTAFTGKRSARYIFNLSDGQPAGQNYGSTPHAGSGWRDTVRQIAIARKAGVGVFSFSVVDSVISQNNEIYGEAFNIDATTDTANRMSAVLRKVMHGNV